MRDEKLTTLAEAALLIRDGSSLGIASPAVGADALVPMALMHDGIPKTTRDLPPGRRALPVHVHQVPVRIVVSALHGLHEALLDRGRAHPA